MHNNDGNQSYYKCDVYLKLDLSRGMEFEVYYVFCSKDQRIDFGVNSKVGLYRFELSVEENVTISCELGEVFKNMWLLFWL